MDTEEKKFKLVEEKWEKYWNEHPEISRANDYGIASSQDKKAPRNDASKPKKYVLCEFPYPSGSGLHIGHAFTYTGGDVYARFKRMQGYNVLFPMGWDAFGLPTENHAIKTKQKPQTVTKKNTDAYRKEMKHLAFSFDWNREVNTTDPLYYKWTQWIFVQLFKKGLAYKEEMPINWCPSCKIGLANEEVVDGKCERCGAEVSRRNISQWIVKITKYADRLIDGLKDTDFIDKVKAAQVNWIDRKEWIDITYQIEGIKDTVTIATTRPDTNFGATFIVLAPEHELASKLLTGEIKTNEDLTNIKKYVTVARNKSELDRQKEVVGRDKTGVFTGLYAINQLTNKKMPIWITDFVLNTVGTGAVVGVPGHDIRDFEFAKQFGLEIIRVVVGSDGNTGPIADKKDVQEKEGKMINSGFLDGMEIHEATTKIMDYLEEKGWGKRSTRYHLRDWIFSRQHYWGEPIPMVYCEHCSQKTKFEILNLKFENNKEEIASSSTSGRTPRNDEFIEKIKKYAEENEIDIDVLINNPGWYPVPEEELPIKLPEVEAYEPTDDGQSPLSKIESFVNTICPVCGGPARRETDTMPNWAGSDWYFLRYMDAKNDSKLVDPDKLKYWGPVDVYIGGDEHNTLHLLYSRFIYQFLYDLGVLVKELPEPYYKRISHGVILGPDNQRMSKSRGNVIVPETVADKYGVDVVRMYLMFMGPFEGTMAWNENTLMGVKRFLDRFEKLFKTYLGGVSQDADLFASDRRELLTIINKKINAITKDLDGFGYNTAIAKLMELLNELEKKRVELTKEDVSVVVRLLAPFAPYMAEELWYWLNFDIRKNNEVIESVHLATWPTIDEKYLVEESITVMVAINGKTRSQLSASAEASADKTVMIKMAMEDPKIKTWIEGKKIVKEIYVPGKMVNLVVA